MPDPSYDSLVTSFRVDFDVDSFRAFIDQKGYQAQWSRWAPCPCARPESGQPNINCPVCRGRGDVFFDPVSCKVEITSLGYQREFQQFSAWNVGSASLTLHDEGRFMNYRDKFVLTDSMSSHSEMRKRPSDLGRTKEYLQYKPEAVISAIKMSSLKTALVTLVQGTDFTIDTDGALTWTSANAPDYGEWYSIVYVYHPTYQVLEILNDIRDTFVMDQQSGVDMFRRMPQRALVKRSHLMYQEEKVP